MKEKLLITKIRPSVLKKKGFDHRGCYDSLCNDSCCRYGCEVDKESYDLIFKNRALIEKRIRIKLEDCFKKKWLDDPEFLGGNAADSRKKNGYCVFRLKEKGCILFELAYKNGRSKRIIPTICRLYPLTWGGQELMITQDRENDCNVLCGKNNSCKNILETQKEHIKDIFELKGKAKEIISSF